MKKFIKYTLSILVVIIALMYLLDTLYTYVYKNSIPRNKVSYLLSLNDKKIDYVFLGSSRVDNNIIAKVIETETGKIAINFGVQGAKLDDYFLMLQFTSVH